MNPLPLTLLSVLFVSLISLLGVVLFWVRAGGMQRNLLPLVSFSTGALLGNVFLHIFPEISVQPSRTSWAFLAVLLGLLFSFALEKLICWHHCFRGHCDHGCKPAGPINLLGDALHNLVDGMAIAGSFLASPSLGISTTVAVALHEIPQEIGDFAILIHSGFRWKSALLFNFLSACGAFLGAILGFAFASSVPTFEGILLPFTAGNFLYIALADLIPELHKEVRPGKTLGQLLWMLLGIGLMALL